MDRHIWKRLSAIFLKMLLMIIQEMRIDIFDIVLNYIKLRVFYIFQVGIEEIY